MSKRHPFIRLADSGAYEYGIYTEGGRAPDEVLGCAETRDEAGVQLITKLTVSRDRAYWVGYFCLGAGMSLIVGSLLGCW